MNTYQSTTTFRFVACLLIIGMLHLSTGCNYYLYATAPNTEDGIYEITQEDYLIIHFKGKTWHLSDVIVDRKQQILSGVKSDISANHQGHEHPIKGPNRYKKANESPTNEIHVYINGFEENSNNTVTIPKNSITRIDVYDQNKELTAFSYVFGTIGSLAVVGLVILSSVLGDFNWF